MKVKFPTMHFQFIKPSDFLAPYIKHYWVLEAADSEGEVCERVIPTGNIEWMFHFGKPFVVNDANTKLFQPRSLASGISSSYFDVSTQGEAGVIAVTFYPYAASHFLRFPLSEIEDSSVNLLDIYSRPMKEVEERISSRALVKERIGIIENFLLKCFKPCKNNDILLIRKGIELINQSKGQLKASDLSKSLLLTNKSLERKFSQYLGKTPKQFIRIVRFQGIIQHYSGLQKKPLTQLSYDNGYFDQAHFIKDFKSLSGYSPREFFGLGPCRADYFV